MDIGKAISFVFEDPEWLKKVAIGAGLAILGVLFTPVLIGLVPLMIIGGYGIRLTRNVMDGDARPLPEWDNWGDLLALGFKIFAIQFIWALPLVILSVASSLPAALADGSDVQGLLAVCSAMCACLSVIVGIAYAVVEPVITFRFARTGQFASGFEFGRIFRLLGSNIANVIIAVIISSVVAGVLVLVGAIVGVLALVIGLIVTLPAAMILGELIQAHLYGQVGREAEAKDQIPVLPEPGSTAI
jgi:hypothetical protein